MPVRVFAVGARGPEAYMAYLKRLQERLGLEKVVFFTGSLQESQLAAHYSNADLFVCLSEHEGFCIPLLEAMRAALPVVAYDGGAVGETLGGSGVLLTTLDPVIVAEVVARVCGDDALSRQLRASESRRAGELDGFDRATVLVRAINDMDL
jgi:glycosyltransferase involved in cell wall biosynthesis